MKKLLVTALGLSLASFAAATDRIVGPGGFSTFSAAVAAALPGDRILLAMDVNAATSGPTPALPADLTITSMPGGPRRTITVQDGGGVPIVWNINTGVTFRNVNLDVKDFDIAGAFGIIIDAPGERVLFDDVGVVEFSFFPTASGALTTLVSITAETVLIKDSSFFVRDAMEFSSVSFLPTPQGGNALGVVATTLVVEDSTLRGGSAPIVRSPEIPGTGGAALTASTVTTLLTRVSLSDGSGGYQNLGTVGDPSAPRGVTSAAGASSLGNVASVAATSRIGGLPGSAPAAPLGRGFPLPLGPADAPLVASGGQNGAFVRIEMNPTIDSSVTAVGYGLGYEFTGPTSTGFGLLFTNPFFFGSLASGSSLDIPLSTTPSSLGRVLVFQSILFRSSLPLPIQFGEPTFVERHL